MTLKIGDYVQIFESGKVDTVIGIVEDFDSRSVTARNIKRVNHRIGGRNEVKSTITVDRCKTSRLAIDSVADRLFIDLYENRFPENKKKEAH